MFKFSWWPLVSHPKSTARWWFQIFFIFTPIWGRFPFWLIFFRWVETTKSDGSYWPKGPALLLLFSHYTYPGSPCFHHVWYVGFMNHHFLSEGLSSSNRVVDFQGIHPIFNCFFAGYPPPTKMIMEPENITLCCRGLPIKNQFSWYIWLLVYI